MQLRLGESVHDPRHPGQFGTHRATSVRPTTPPPRPPSRTHPGLEPGALQDGRHRELRGAGRCHPHHWHHAQRPGGDRGRRRAPEDEWNPMDPAVSSPLVAWLASDESQHLTGQVIRAVAQNIIWMKGWTDGPSSPTGAGVGTPPSSAPNWPPRCSEREPPAYGSEASGGTTGPRGAPTLDSLRGWSCGHHWRP